MIDFVFFPTVGITHLQQDLRKRKDFVEKIFLNSKLEEVGEQMAHYLPVCAFGRAVFEDDVRIKNVLVLFVGGNFHFFAQLKVKNNIKYIFKYLIPWMELQGST